MDSKSKITSFWDKICYLSELRDIKPHAALKELGISSGAANKWKKGTLPNGEILMKIAKYFDVSIDSLLDFREEMQDTIYSEALIHKIINEAKLLTLKDLLGIYDRMGKQETALTICVQSEENTWLKATTAISDVLLAPFEDCIIESFQASSDSLQIWLITDDKTGKLIEKATIENGAIMRMSD